MTLLGDVVEMTVGYAFKSRDFTENVDDIRLLRGDNIAQGFLRWQSAKRISQQNFDVEDYRLRVGDVVLAMDRPWIEAGLKYSVVRDADVPSLLVQRVARLRAREGLDQSFLGYVIGSREFTDHVLAVQTGSTVPHISGKQILEFKFDRLPSLPEQQSIAAVLGVLDQKIDSSRRARSTLRSLGLSLLVQAQVESCTKRFVGDVTVSIARGVTPKYADDNPEAPLVINQKCVRDNWVSTALARRMVDRPVASSKKVSAGDVLVNSTGTGTLGRVGRWHKGDIFADSHVTIVKAHPEKVGPTTLAYLLFGREKDIEDMAAGSTGQTELNATRLGQLEICIPDQNADVLECTLNCFEERAAALIAEEASLSRLRDTLLPELLSGRIRVPEAAEALA